jgi:enterochelin esterase-like enzyme
MTFLTLVVAAVIVGWAAAMLAEIVRRFVVAAARDARAMVAARPMLASRLRRPGVAIVTLIVLVATLPVFADLVNFTPDAHMRTGTVPVPGVADNGSIPGASSSPRGSTRPRSSGVPNPSTAAAGGLGDPGRLPADLVAGPVAGSLITPDVVTTGRPWSASVPTGVGQVIRINLPAPWTHGTASVTVVDVYLPAGYGTGRVRYPVVYEAPFAIAAWVNGIGVKSMLDDLVATGAIPPMIFVFASEFGGPYRDAECADSFDGIERFDTYMATKLVSYMDTHYKTIAKPAARATLGDSQGGYCSVALWSHHPDVFESAMSFSGYFVSGIASTQTRNAPLPFGSNAAYEASQSPINIVPGLSAAVRSNSFVVLSAGTDHSLYATQLRAFAAVLDSAQVPMAIFPSKYGHSWQTPRELLPAILELLAERMVKLGVLGAP